MIDSTLTPSNKVLCVIWAYNLLELLMENMENIVLNNVKCDTTIFVCVSFLQPHYQL